MHRPTQFIKYLPSGPNRFSACNGCQVQRIKTFNAIVLLGKESCLEHCLFPVLNHSSTSTAICLCFVWTIVATSATIGSITISGAATAASGTVSAQIGFIPVSIGGVTKYIALYTSVTL